MHIRPIDKQATKQMEKSLQRKLKTGKVIFSPRNTLNLDDIVELESPSSSSRDELDDDLG